MPARGHIDRRALFSKLNPWIKRRLWHLRSQTANEIAQAAGCIIDPKAEIEGYLPGIALGGKVRIERYACLNCYDSESSLILGDRCMIMPYAMLLTHPSGQITLGSNCSVNPFTVLYGHGGLQIGNDVRIATHTVIIPANHNFDDLGVPIRLQGLSKRGITIEDDVWIGANCVILDGSHIGRGSVIAAGSVVSSSVPPGSIVAGIPGKVIRRRGERE